MTNPPHTGLPWAVCDTPLNMHWHKGNTIFSVEEGVRVADTTPLDMRDKDNSGFIVKACNAYYDLTAENARLKEALRFYADVNNILFMEEYGFLEYGDRNIALQATRPFGETARAALTSSSPQEKK